MKRIISIATIVIALGLVSCQTAEDISNGLDHQVPDCKALTLTANGQTKVISDSISSLLLWGVVPQTNMEKITLPTVTATKGDTITISVVLSDNVALKTADLAYADWLFDKYINFTNPEGNIPKTPKSYTFIAKVAVPDNAVTTPWLEDYYFNDGSSMKITQAYHKLTLTVVDINMNQRIIPIFVKVE
ncbi:MAG: hypothetical protein Q8904_00175 [Bacteroidota bacterium]|nr:hypothetical protein [Bacteroidota bacterium]